MRERLKPTMVQLSLPVKVKHLQSILAFNRQTFMTCARRQQVLQRYMKSAMQVCFVFFDPASLIQANFALRRWYDTPAMLHLSAIPSRSPNCTATSVYGGGRGESTGCVNWPLSPAEASASSSSESTFRRAANAVPHSCSSVGRALRPVVQTSVVCECLHHELSLLQCYQHVSSCPVHALASPSPFSAFPGGGASKTQPQQQGLRSIPCGCSS